MLRVGFHRVGEGAYQGSVVFKIRQVFTGIYAFVHVVVAMCVAWGGIGVPNHVQSLRHATRRSQPASDHADIHAAKRFVPNRRVVDSPTTSMPRSGTSLLLALRSSAKDASGDRWNDTTGEG